MIHKIKLTYILITCLLLVVFGGAYVIWLKPSVPAGNFDSKAAISDVTPFSNYARGQVVEVVSENIDEGRGWRTINQQLAVLLEDAADQQPISVTNDNILDQAQSVRYKAGDRVVLGQVDGDDGNYVIVDRYRLSGIYLIIGFFLLITIAIGRRKGFNSLIGLAVTGAILLLFIAPQILAGKNAMIVALVGSSGIVLASMFISHGFTRRIKIAAVSTLASLFLAVAVSYVFIRIVNLFGLGGSDAFLLETGYFGSINLQGILLAGMIISILGVLDDVTTVQTAAVEEIHNADSSFSVKDLYLKGLSIGREHIASLINTLILVYAGAALPLFLLLTLQKSQPFWVLLNSEFIAEELVRSLIGAAALILAVPISTFLAAYVYGYKTKNQL